jgi:choline dehydrogenase-like flavoprotein
MERARSFFLFILSPLFPSRPEMTEKVRKRKQRVVIIGGGVAGSLLARELSSKLNKDEHELLLIEARPYAIWLIAGARLVTEEGHHPGLEGRAFVPHEKLFRNGTGCVKRGKAVSIHCYSNNTPTDTRGGGANGHNHSGYILLEDGEEVPYDALIFATGSKYSGPVDFPDDPVQCLAHLEHWRAAFRDARDIMLVGGGGVAVGM